MRTQFDPNIRIVREDTNQFVQALHAFWAKSGFIEIIENILQALGFLTRCKEKVHIVGLTLLGGIGLEFYVLIQITRCSGKHYIASIALHAHLIGAIVTSSHESLSYGAAFAYDPDSGSGYGIFFSVHHITLNLGVDSRQFEMEEVRPSACIASVGTKYAFDSVVRQSSFFVFAFGLHSQAEIIGRGIDRLSHIDYMPSAGRVQRGFENIQSSQTGVSVRSEEKGTIPIYEGKHFVPRRIDIRPQILR